jgi:hypothetical protein
MGAAEATERLGSFKYGASVKFEWTDESSTLELSETRSLLASRGGVAGDFHATAQNSRDQGLEVIRVGGRVFARSRYGKFRERKRDRGMAEREREEVFGSLSDFSELFGHRVKLEGKGTTSVAGRKAYRYQASLGTQKASEREEALPPRPEPKGGMDISSKRRLAFLEQRVPNSLSGEILVDADTGVVLKAKLSGKIAVPPQANQKRAQLALTIDSSISDIDKEREVAIAVPKDYLPDEDKPRGIAVALEKFGVSSTPETDEKQAQPDEAAEPADER